MSIIGKLNIREELYLSHLLLFKLVPPDQCPAFHGPATPVIDQSLLVKEVGLIISL